MPSSSKMPESRIKAIRGHAPQGSTKTSASRGRTGGLNNMYPITYPNPTPIGPQGPQGPQDTIGPQGPQGPQDTIGPQGP